MPQRRSFPSASAACRSALLAYANNPLVSDTIAAALIAGAAALADRKKKSGVAKAAGLGAGAAAVKASKGANRVGVAVLIALAEVAVGALARRAGNSKQG